MQRLMSRQLLAQMSALAAQSSSAAPPAPMYQQLPCLASFAGGLLRHASSDAAPPGDSGVSTEPPASTADAAASAGDTDESADAAAAEEGEQEIDLDDIELTDRGFQKALSFRGGVPERRGRRPTRAEKGSYVDNFYLEQELTDIATKVPDDVTLYDLNTAAPGLSLPRSDALDEMMAYGQAHMEELLADVGLNPMQVGRRPILRWTVRMRLDTSGLPNPVNRYAKCQVYLRELQEEAGLTDAALRHIALVAGTRYNPKNGELTLTSERYPEREENRLHIMDMLHALIAEGERVYPSEPTGEESPQAAVG